MSYHLHIEIFLVRPLWLYPIVLFIYLGCDTKLYSEVTLDSSFFTTFWVFVSFELWILSETSGA